MTLKLKLAICLFKEIRCRLGFEVDHSLSDMYRRVRFSFSNSPTSYEICGVLQLRRSPKRPVVPVHWYSPTRCAGFSNEIQFQIRPYTTPEYIFFITRI